MLAYLAVYILEVHLLWGLLPKYTLPKHSEFITGHCIPLNFIINFKRTIIKTTVIWGPSWYPNLIKQIIKILLRQRKMNMNLAIRKMLNVNTDDVITLKYTEVKWTDFQNAIKEKKTATGTLANCWSWRIHMYTGIPYLWSFLLTKNLNILSNEVTSGLWNRPTHIFIGRLATIQNGRKWKNYPMNDTKTTS